MLWEIYNENIKINYRDTITTAHPYCDGHSTSIIAYGVWGPRAGVQVLRRELYTHIHLD